MNEPKRPFSPEVKAEAVRAYATVGEIVELWRKRFGTFLPSTEF